jgi:hypothetical protein
MVFPLCLSVAPVANTTPGSLDCASDASLVPETCLEFFPFQRTAIAVSNSVVQIQPQGFSKDWMARSYSPFLKVLDIV